MVCSCLGWTRVCLSRHGANVVARAGVTLQVSKVDDKALDHQQSNLPAFAEPVTATSRRAFDEHIVMESMILSSSVIAVPARGVAPAHTSRANVRLR